jgi:nicotinamidase-related amidase
MSALETARAYVEEQKVEETVTAAISQAVREKAPDAIARISELLAEKSGGGKGFSVFSPAEAKGGAEMDKTKMAVLFIEFQNEFTTEGGKLHYAVKGCMESNDMLANAAKVAAACREQSVKVMHTAIMFKEDASDNPNKGLGILAGCAGGLFTEGTWNAEFCKAMEPALGDIIVTGKKGLDAFPHSDLEELLVKNGVETLALAGFLSNCCVESTMRTAYEKGFNVITLTDCTATMDMDQHKGALAGSYGMFSKPMTADEFIAALA